MKPIFTFGRAKKIVTKDVDVIEAPLVVVAPVEIAKEDIKPSAVVPTIFLVRWTGGEEVFKTKSEADFAVRTRVGAHIVPGGVPLKRDQFGQIVV